MDETAASLPAHRQSQSENSTLLYSSESGDETQGRRGGLSLADLVASQAQASPSAIALIQGGKTLNYRELEISATRLANHLLRAGASQERPVALCLPRSNALVVSALAAIKAGAPYVPTDPEWPPDRLAFVLKDCGASVVIAQDEVAARIPPGSCRVLNFDHNPAEISLDATSRTAVTPQSQDLAYIIYTSGSTGEPKGVEVPHRGLLNLVHWHQHAFRVAPADRATLLASPGFDASVWEMWPYLCSGASLDIPDDCLRNDPEGLRDWLVRRGITITFAATPLAERMIELAWPAHTPLRLMLTGADTLHRYPSIGLPFELVNNYGPTECTVVATSGTVPKGAVSSVLPSIGRPIDNTEVYILDQQLQPVVPGATGELCIGGSGVARGYRNRPALTDKKFVANPFSADPEARLYRTGDLAQALPDGQFAFIGRTDDQIKVRGYRIEPAEVVARLDEHAAIQASHVAAIENPRSEKDLVAYVVPRNGSEVSDDDLRRFLQERLPDYMVPSVFVCLEAMPLNMSGKVDRESLPKPDASNVLGSRDLPEADSVLEGRVGEIVAGLLGLQRIDPSDNFFMLGGNSLLGAQVIARIAEVFSVEISLRRLFEGPTVAQLCVEIERLLTEKVEELSEEEAQRELGSLAP